MCEVVGEGVALMLLMKLIKVIEEGGFGPKFFLEDVDAFVFENPANVGIFV